MKSGIGRPLLLAAILGCALLETALADENITAVLFGALALVLAGSAIPLISWDEFRTDVTALACARRVPAPRVPPPVDPADADHRFPLGPPLPAPPPAPRTGGVAVAEPPTTPQAFPAPPRFGLRGSPASRLPWLLPRFTAPAAVNADEAQIGGVSVRAASVIGPGHRCVEPVTPRQDSYSLGRDTAGRFLIVAVADGLSSGIRSEIGAGIAARHAVDEVRTRLDATRSVSEVDAGAVFAEVSAAMTHAADQAGLAPSDICAVLVTAVVDLRPDPVGAHLMWIAWIGDASVWALTDRVWRFLAGDEKDAVAGLASNAVSACLPQHPNRVRCRTVPIRSGEAVAVVTDGVGDALLGIPEANAYFAERWARPPSLGAFLNDMCFDARQQLDDRTAVVLWTPTP